MPIPGTRSGNRTVLDWVLHVVRHAVRIEGLERCLMWTQFGLQTKYLGVDAF